MQPLVGLFLAGVVACSAPQQNLPACEQVNPELRRAVQDHVKSHHDTGIAMSEDQHELEWAGREIREHGTEVLPCLVDVFRRGLGPTGLWVYDKPAPKESRWVIQLIRLVDASVARTLYREWLGQAEDALDRFSIQVELASLGDEEFLPDIAAFLDQLVGVPETEVSRRRILQTRAVQVLSLCNYRPALPVLKRMNAARPSHAHGWLPVYIAQLSDDAELVTRYAHDPELATWALRALRRMGREDVLRKLANDPTYRHRSAAKDLLAGEPSSL